MSRHATAGNQSACAGVAAASDRNNKQGIHILEGHVKYGTLFIVIDSENILCVKGTACENKLLSYFFIFCS